MTIKHGMWFILSQEIMFKSSFNKIASNQCMHGNSANIVPVWIILHVFIIGSNHGQYIRSSHFVRTPWLKTVLQNDCWISFALKRSIHRFQILWFDYFWKIFTMILVWPAICGLTVFYADILLRVNTYVNSLSIRTNEFSIN